MGWIGIVHGLDYLTTLMLIGVVAFSAWVLPIATKSPHGAPFPEVGSRLRRLLGASLVFSALWLVVASADMTGSWNPLDLWDAVSQTRFGQLWSLRLGISALLFAIGSIHAHRARSALFGIGVLALPVFSGLTGHAATSSFPPLWIAVDWLHSVAAGTWAGGLYLLIVWLTRHLSRPESASDLSLQVVRRFSQLAMASSGSVFLTGLLMSYSYGVSLLKPWNTPYGTLVLAKTLLFGATLIAASINHFGHLRRWNSGRATEFARNVRREASIELALVILIFGIAGFLTRSDLPGLR